MGGNKRDPVQAAIDRYSHLGQEQNSRNDKSLVAKQKGHWPAGRRRNEDAVSGGWERLRTRLLEQLRRGVIPRKRSRRQAAAELGVSVRTVCRWLAGVDWPQAKWQRRLEQVLAKWMRIGREFAKR